MKNHLLCLALAILLAACNSSATNKQKQVKKESKTVTQKSNFATNLDELTAHYLFIGKKQMKDWGINEVKVFDNHYFIKEGLVDSMICSEGNDIYENTRTFKYAKDNDNNNIIMDDIYNKTAPEGQRDGDFYKNKNGQLSSWINISDQDEYISKTTTKYEYLPNGSVNYTIFQVYTKGKNEKKWKEDGTMYRLNQYLYYKNCLIGYNMDGGGWDPIKGDACAYYQKSDSYKMRFMKDFVQDRFSPLKKENDALINHKPLKEFLTAKGFSNVKYIVFDLAEVINTNYSIGYNFCYFDY